jgi:thioredoxin reductase (NADPH)
MSDVYDIIIIGGGPGGIGSAIEAKALGLEKILLLEKSDNHSDTIRKFYKDNKRVDKDWQGQIVEIEGSVPFSDGTKESTLDFFDDLIKSHKIDAFFNCEVDKITKNDGLFSVRSSKGDFIGKNIVIAIGRMGKPNKPSYKIPPKLRSRVNFNLDKCSEGEKILIVGGGDSATEYAVELGKSNDVTLNYRRDKISRPNPTNIALIEKAFEDGTVRPKLGVDIDSLEESDDGLVKVNYKDGTSEIFDRVIYAIGGTTPVDFLKSANLTLDSKGEPIIKENLESSVDGIYIAGDIAFKSGGSIAIALNHGYRIVKDILGKKESE